MTDYYDEDEAEFRINKKKTKRENDEFLGKLFKLPPEEREEVIKTIQKLKKKN